MTQSFTLSTCPNFKQPLVSFSHSHKITRVYQSFGTFATKYRSAVDKHL